MERVRIGRIVNTRGLKGEVKIINCSDFANERYKKNNKIIVSNDDRQINKEITVESSRQTDKFILVKFREIDTIEEADKYKESDLFVDISISNQKEKNSFHHSELINLDVFYKNEKIGHISEICSNNVQDLIRVEDNKKSFLVPFIDEFIIDVDINNKKIFLKNIEGLI